MCYLPRFSLVCHVALELTLAHPPPRQGYFLSHAAFVVRDVASGAVLGAFYVKPNFPGRCSHICNGGTRRITSHT